MIYSLKNQNEQAIAAIKKAISIDPNHSDAYNDMADVLMNVGRPEEAIEAIEKAIRLNPHHPNVFQVKLGGAYFMLGRYDEAVKSYKKALILNPNFIWTYLGLSNTYISMWYTQQSQNSHVLDRALKRSEQALNLGASPIMSHAFLSYIYLFKKKYDQAIHHAEKALITVQNNPDINNLKGFLFVHSGNPKDALELLENADLNIRHESAKLLLYIKGMAYRLNNRYDEAIKSQKHVLLDNSVYHLSFLAHLELTILYSELNQIKDAQAEASELLKLAPDFSVEVWGQRNPIKDQAQIKRDMAALRKAGLK